ncbi:protease modulator HflK N-terminal domain-containing protein, partial [Aromatoleum petrolei]
MSLNDPRWGNNQGNGDDKRGDDRRGGNQGPPDLEDLWRDFNQRLSGMLGGKRGPRGGGGGD